MQQLPMTGGNSDPENAIWLHERAFLQIGLRWQNTCKATEAGTPMDRESDLDALACLLMAKEQASYLTAWSVLLCCQNRELRKGTHLYLCDGLPWELCGSGLDPTTLRAAALAKLLALLQNPNSGLRGWALEMAWVVREWLHAEQVIPSLFRIIGQCIQGIGPAAGLALALCRDEEVFWKEIKAFRCDPKFQRQLDSWIAKAEQQRQELIGCRENLEGLEIRLRERILGALLEAQSTPEGSDG